MPLTVQNLRDLVRTQMDLDEEDLPNELLDGYIREGYDETVAVEGRWPFFESSWSVPLETATSTSIARPDDLQVAVSVVDSSTGVRLTQIAHDVAEDNQFATRAAGEPCLWSTWAGRIYLWPIPDGDRTVLIRGFRKPSDWVGQGAGGVVDADERLHRVIVHYAVSRAYAQQEDDVLEAEYRDTWARALASARTAIMRPDKSSPLILNGNRRVTVLPRWRLGI